MRTILEIRWLSNFLPCLSHDQGTTVDIYPHNDTEYKWTGQGN